MVAEASKSTALVGMTEICAHMRRSEKTMLDLIRCEGFPAKKIGGIWESDTRAVDSWRLLRIAPQERDEGLRVRS